MDGDAAGGQGTGLGRGERILRTTRGRQSPAAARLVVRRGQLVHRPPAQEQTLHSGQVRAAKRRI